MADPNWAHGRSSTPNAGAVGQIPPSGPMMSGNNPYPMAGQPKSSVLPPGPHTYNNQAPSPPQPGQHHSGPNQANMQGRPPQPNMGPRPGAPGPLRPGPPGTFGAPGPYPGSGGGASSPPGTFGAPPGQFQPPSASNSATPPPFLSGNIAPQGPGIPKNTLAPAMPPGGQYGPPMVNGLPPSQPGAPPGPGQLAGPTRPALHNGQSMPPGHRPQQQPGPPGPLPRAPGPGGYPQSRPWQGQVNSPPGMGGQVNSPPGMAGQANSPPSMGTARPEQPGYKPSPPTITSPPGGNQRPALGPGLPQPRLGPPPTAQQQAQAVQQGQGRPNELPLPYHGQGQYSHQVPGLANMVTPGITPNSSEPPSQKSSRSTTPEPALRYDALEGQFSSSTAQGGQFSSPPASQGQSPPGQQAQTSAGPGYQGQSPPSLGQPPGQLGQSVPPMGGQPPGLQGQPPPPQGPHGQPPPPTGVQPQGPHGQPPPPTGVQPQGQSPPPMGTHPIGTQGQTSMPGSYQGPVVPPSGPTGTGSGITGRRHYPQMPPSQPPAYGNQVPPPYSGGVTPQNQNAAVPSSMPGGQPPPAYTANNAYPGTNTAAALNSNFNNMKLQPDAQRPINLLQEKNLLPREEIDVPKPNLPPEYKKANCNPEIFRCTLNSIPHTQSLLTKSRLPLGILIHPFKDLAQLPVIQSSVIVRCRSCRTYINPFVTFVDMRRWKCNLCYRANELPEEFNYDPVSKTYGEPQRRPEIRSGTIEFIAPSEYMLRPPQPAVYLFLLDVSFNAIETGYLQAFCQTLLDELDRLPGDARTQIGFLGYDSSLYFFNLGEGLSQPQLLVVSDLEEVYIPSPDNLLVNLNERRELITELLNILPDMFKGNLDTSSALGPALESAFKLMGATGGRVSVFQTQLPTVGSGALKSREDPNERSGKKVNHLGPATDFYKKLSLDCSAQQIAVDLFMLNSQYADIASIACVSKFSGGSVHYFPGYHALTNPPEAERFEGTLRRYLTRKIGFEAVMRIRCSRGLSIHTFHGNFFVRSTDLLSLPNVNPDAGFGMQMSIEDTIEANYVCFQAALLYTSSKGERRIRVHTLAIPITQQLSDVHANADQLAIIALLSKMGADKSLSSSLGDARDAMINSAIDMLGSYGSTLTSSQRMGQLPCPYTLRLQPMFTLGLLKSLAFRVGSSTKLDDRVFHMEACKNLPVCYLLMMIYPRLYPVHNLDDKENVLSKGDTVVPQPPLLQLTSASMDRHGAYLMDAGTRMFLWVGAAISDQFCRDILDKPNFSSIADPLFELPELDNGPSDLLRSFIGYLNDQRPFPASLVIMREDSRARMQFLENMVEDRTESTFSYYEFLQHLQKEVRS